MSNLRYQIELEEGRRHRAYPDPLTGAGPWTIGIGHTGPEVTRGLVWSDAQIDASFTKDLAKFTRQVLDALPWVSALSEPRQAVLIGMAYQMGTAGLLKFRNTLAAVKAGEWDAAARGIQTSAWSRQTPERAGRMARQMLDSTWHLNK